MSAGTTEESKPGREAREACRQDPGARLGSEPGLRPQVGEGVLVSGRRTVGLQAEAGSPGLQSPACGPPG